MKLASVNVGIPIFAVRASVEHSIVRKPTVFERMVLRLSRRGQGNQFVGDTTLRQAFEQQLGVQGVPQLLAATVSELVRLGALQPASAPGQSLLDQPIRTVLLTPEGEEFYNRNTLPSSPTKDAVDYVYEPWSNTLSKSLPAKLAELAPEFTFNVATLRPRDPSSLVRRELKDHPPRFLKKDSRIISVDAEVAEAVSWVSIDVEVHASPEGYLDLKTQSKSYENWLLKLQPSVVEEAFLDSLNGGSSTSIVELPREVLAQAKSLTLATATPTPPVQSVALPDIGEGGVTIHLHPNGDVVHFTRNDPGGAVISCPAPGAVPQQMVSVTVEGGRSTGCLLDGAVGLTWSGALRYVHVEAELEGRAAAEYWQLFSDGLAASMATSNDAKVVVIPLHWNSDRPIELLSEQMGNLPRSQWLENAREFLTAAHGSEVRFTRPQAGRLAEMLTAGVAGSTDSPILDISEVREWLNLIATSLGDDASSSKLKRAFLSQAATPESLQEVHELFRLESDLKNIPARLLGPTVLAAVLEELWNDPSKSLPAGGVEGLLALEAYRAAQASLDVSLGRRNADLTATRGRVLAESSIGDALRATEQWLTAVDDPRLAQATGNTFPPGLQRLRERTQVWREGATENLVHDLGSDQIALVFDSNTLLDYPDAIRHLGSSQIGVIPNRVIQELDGLKRSQDGSTAQRARAATRTIDELREGNSLRFENARTDLISPDFGSTDEPDNQILSVAIAFSGSRVALVTGDKNLRAKAQASNIESKNWPRIQKDGGGRE